MRKETVAGCWRPQLKASSQWTKNRQGKASMQNIQIILSSSGRKWSKWGQHLAGTGELPTAWKCVCPSLCVRTHTYRWECEPSSSSPARVLMMMSGRFHGTSLECSSAVHQAKLQHRDRQMTGLKRCQGSSRLTSQTELVWSFHNSKDTSYETTAMGTHNPADPVRPPSSYSSRAAP